MAKHLSDSRPDPDALLAQARAEGGDRTRGRLKVFFGAAAGVGKTYAMLSAGRAKAMEGVDVVVGYAEPHARPETEMLILGMELLPYRIVEYRGAQLKEFDLEAALARRPELILVDELAHTNAPVSGDGMRHAKRWQDVAELLEAGIDVHTTLNVQHLESLNDVVAQITGVVVRETLPDAVFERADEVELVDLPPEELLERLSEGKVYFPEQAAMAVRGFFKKPNLTALRELALRKTADRVSDDVRSARQQQLAPGTWPTAERILVCVSPSPSSARVIRAAKRLAVALHAQWIAAFVEPPSARPMTPGDRDRLLSNFKLAERLGAETLTLTGANASDEIISYAHARNITKIIAGKPDQPWWKDLLFRSLVDNLLRKSGDIDVYVVRGIGRGLEELQHTQTPPAKPAIDWAALRWTVLVLLVCTGVAWAMHVGFNLGAHDDLSNLIMVYLAGVVFVAARYGRLASVVAAVLSVLIFDLGFVPPRLHLTVNDTQYLFTFIVMLGVALLIGNLTVRIREQAQASRERERRTGALYRMTEQLAGTKGLSELAEVAVQHLREVFGCSAVVLIADEQRRLAQRAASDAGVARRESELAVAQWVFERRQPAGRGTDTLPAADCLYLPLLASRGPVGVLGVQSPQVQDLLGPRQRQSLEAFASQIALAIERDQLAQEARLAQVQAEAEKLRSSLLSSVSHDLRTPLAVITGASSSLIESGATATTAQRELIQTIHDESNRLTRLVGNLLDITRLESGAVQLNKQWHPLEEIVGSALNHLEPLLAGRPVHTHLPPDLPLVPVDGVLIEQVLINLVDNALKYSPTPTPIDIRAASAPGTVTVEVLDRGPGLGVGEEAQVFEKFYRGRVATPQRGAGLGLAICRAIVETHGGRIWAENRGAPGAAGGQTGAAFRFTLPVTGTPPAVPDLPSDSV